ncbi:MAG: O-antigen ligase family protein [Gammaproteobacteria bacterium]|nr:O-antigen ligase family protein [Gammaproteobacteria bacterium]
MVAIIAVLVPGAAWHRLQGITKLTSIESGAQTERERHPSEPTNRLDRLASDSAQQRFDILRTGWHIFTSHPVTGVGIGCYNEANARYTPELGARDAHNTYIHLAAEMGVPGLLLWLGLVGSVLAQVRRLRTRLEADDRTIQVLWIERATIAYLIAAIFASYSGLTMFYLFLGTLWAATNVLGRDAPAPTAVAPRAVPGRRALRAR